MVRIYHGAVVLTLLLVPLQLQAAVIDECEGLQSSDIFIDAQVLYSRGECSVHVMLIPGMQCYSRTSMNAIG